MKKFIVLAFLMQILAPASMLAQTENPDFMHSTGKIYVVVAVIAVIFVGIIGFLIYLERKLTKLESQILD